MIAMVLAAGLGTRLRPLTERTAKPALPLLGTTLLGANLDLLARAGIRQVVVNASWRAATVAAAARSEAARLGLAVHLSFEPAEPLGTGGALVAARPLLDRGEPFVLLNGDVLADLDVAEAVRAHAASGAATTMVLRERAPGESYAGVEVDDRGRVVRIAGEGPGGEGPTRELIFTGLHVLGPSIFEVLPPSGVSCVNRQGHVRLLARGVHAHAVAPRLWSDVGTPERYAAANLDLLERGGAPGHGLRDTVAIAPGVHVHAAARVDAGAELRGPCYVGEGAVVERGASVGPRAVVLAGARVRGAVRDGVVAPGVEVPAGATVTGLAT